MYIVKDDRNSWNMGTLPHVPQGWSDVCFARRQGAGLWAARSDIWIPSGKLR